MLKTGTALWFELYGPLLKARGIDWSYDFDTDKYKFYRILYVAGETLSKAAHKEAQEIINDIGNKNG